MLPFEENWNESPTAAFWMWAFDALDIGRMMVDEEEVCEGSVLGRIAAVC